VRKSSSTVRSSQLSFRALYPWRQGKAEVVTSISTVPYGFVMKAGYVMNR
jgi:hypothetical protein